MANKRNIFSTTSAMLGTIGQPKSTSASPVPLPVPAVQTEILDGGDPLERFTVYHRTGVFWSYPYSFVGLIECPSGSELTLHCNCGTVRAIVITGRGLKELAQALTETRLQRLAEGDHATFAQYPCFVSTVTIKWTEEAAMALEG